MSTSLHGSAALRGFNAIADALRRALLAGELTPGAQLPPIGEMARQYGATAITVRRALRALERVGLGDRTHHAPNELSGGQQQRVAIARALVNEPAMILADEPTGNLDSRSGTEVMKIFQQLNREKGITTIFVTHDPWIARHTNRVIMLRDGVVIADREVAKPLVAGDIERPSEAEELESVFKEAYYGGKETEYT